MSQLSLRIKQLRKEYDMTQIELASNLGVGKTTISNYETAYSIPDADTLVKIAKIFNVTTDYLLGKSDQRNFQETLVPEKTNENSLNSVDDKLSDRVIHLARNMESLDERDLNTLDSLIESMAKAAREAKK